MINQTVSLGNYRKLFPATLSHSPDLRLFPVYSAVWVVNFPFEEEFHIEVVTDVKAAHGCLIGSPLTFFLDFFFQYEDSGALDIFLTPSQKAWFNTLKKAANKKPKKMISRPQVSTSCKPYGRRLGSMPAFTPKRIKRVNK